ncbi:hypothetical protein SAMN05660493_01482 [Epilithonimonas bovis DSM 19482]|uniref:Uncharacterized protein n=1 Tax=Epilithonimonas bovis DSM 19482 TaxID=1121284 RepID=A0A1U7PVQ6_9FLAO|nr:hypothetical protein [Epilithonimonas bovis]SIT96787.1 hypothetical protein SAMN05660493_01482 [Epilithonimonas bovis DSM 19482]
MKIRRKGSWKEWSQVNKRHNLQIAEMHIATIIGVFLAAAIFQYM